MIKRIVTSLAVCAIYISSCIPTASMATADGTPYGGTAPVISTKTETSIYAALKNENAPGSGKKVGGLRLKC